jgi:hypothetical protein
MKVLFLDFDGPLFSDRVILHHPANKKVPDDLKFSSYMLYWKMDEVAVGMLNKLYQRTYFELVISSTWRTLFTKEQIATILEVNDLKIPLHENWCTPYRLSYTSRAHDISSWLGSNEVKDYIILDDPLSGDGLQDCTLDNIILVEPEIGITIDDFLKMQNIVNSW